ncbi:hypothetical protein BS78_04G297900 [Paspalum vaginatum]|nr:hypothetical protein BS78_04G297900 [Paspalum vaginatum]
MEIKASKASEAGSMVQSRSIWQSTSNPPPKKPGEFRYVPPSPNTVPTEMLLLVRITRQCMCSIEIVHAHAVLLHTVEMYGRNSGSCFLATCKRKTPIHDQCSSTVHPWVFINIDLDARAGHLCSSTSSLIIVSCTSIRRSAAAS